MKKKFLLSMVLLSFFLMIGTNLKAQDGGGTIAAPTIKATAVNNSSIKLTWGQVENATSYNVYKEGDLISNVVGTVDTVAGLNYNTNYCFTVTALNGELESEHSKEACVNTKNLSAPNNFKASNVTTSEIKLSWSKATYAVSYNIYDGGVLISNVTATNYLVTGLDHYTEYCFTVTTLSGEQESLPTAELCVKTLDLPIATPENFGAGVISTPKEIELTWSKMENALSYNVYKGDEKIANVTDNRYVFDYSDENTEYCFSVTSVRNEQESARSSISVTPASCIAMIGEKGYSNLKAAVAAANVLETGATIEIISDFNLTENLTISKNITIQGEHALTRGVAYTGTFFTVNSGATLTLDGGIVIDGNNNWTMDMDMYWEDVYSRNTIAKENSNKWFTLEEGKPIATAYMFITTGGTINLNNVTIQNNYSSGSGVVSASAASTINLNGAQLKHICAHQGQGIAVYASGNGIEVNVEEGSSIEGFHVGSNHGVFMIYNGAKFTMNGGKIKNTTAWNSNGVAMGFYSTTTYDPSMCVINAGEICSSSSVRGPSNGYNNAIYIHSYSIFEMNGGSICHNLCGAYSSVLINKPNNVSITITGGSIVDNVSVTGSAYTDFYDNANIAQITGGTFTQDISQWLDPDCGLIYDEETGNYTVPNNEDENVFVFKNDEDNNWHNADSWSKGSVPSENATVVIASPVVIKSGNVAYADAVSIGADITIEDGGQLYHNNQKVNAKFEKIIEGDEIQGDNYVGGWYTISSPMEGSLAFSKVANLTNESYDLYRYNESAEIWENAKVEDNGFTTIESGRGYLYANTKDTELQFSGKLCVKDVNYTLSAETKGFNLIGNPFAHNITSDHFSGAALSEGFYVLTKAGEWGAKLWGSGSTIAPCQGALVQTQQHNTVLTISKNTNAKRRSNNGAIAISVSNGKYSDNAYVSFGDGFGLNKINHQNPDAPMLYIPMDGEKFAVAVMEKGIEEVPVAFKAMKMGEYTISATAESCKFSELYLVDRVTGKETNLNIDSYTFIASTSDSPERFYIRMSSDASSDNFAFVNNGELIINNIEGDGYIRIFDVMGRPIAECNAYESARISVTTFADGVYIIQKVDDNGINVQKVMVK